MNLIIKSKPVNWKAITGGYQLTGFLAQIPQLLLLLCILRLIYTQALLNYSLKIFILKEKMIVNDANENASASQNLGASNIKKH